MNGSMLEMVYEGANDLHQADVMNDSTLCEFDALSLPKVMLLTTNQIKRLRLKNKASQGVFAAYLNTSKFS